MIEAPAKKKPPGANGVASKNEKDYESAQTITDRANVRKPWVAGGPPSGIFSRPEPPEPYTVRMQVTATTTELKSVWYLLNKVPEVPEVPEVQDVDAKDAAATSTALVLVPGSGRAVARRRKPADAAEREAAERERYYRRNPGGILLTDLPAGTDLKAIFATAKATAEQAKLERAAARKLERQRIKFGRPELTGPEADEIERTQAEEKEQRKIAREKERDERFYAKLDAEEARQDAKDQRRAAEDRRAAEETRLAAEEARLKAKASIPGKLVKPKASTNLEVIAKQIATAHEVCVLHRTAHEVFMTNAAKIGELLARVKAMLDHGAYLPWVKANCSFSTRTAADYVRLAGSPRNEQPSANFETAPASPKSLKEAVKPKRTRRAAMKDEPATATTVKPPAPKRMTPGAAHQAKALKAAHQAMEAAEPLVLEVAEQVAGAAINMATVQRCQKKIHAAQMALTNAKQVLNEIEATEGPLNEQAHHVH